MVKRLGGENFKSDDVSEISHKALDDLKLFLINFRYDGIIRSDGKHSEEDVKADTDIEAIYVGVLEKRIIYATEPILNRKVRR